MSIYTFIASDYVDDIFYNVEELADDIIKLKYIRTTNQLCCGNAVLQYILESVPYIGTYDIVDACHLLGINLSVYRTLNSLRNDVLRVMEQLIIKQFISRFNGITLELTRELDKGYSEHVINDDNANKLIRELYRDIINNNPTGQ